MAEVPLELPTGRVVGKFIFEVQDNNDLGAEPQLVPVTGDVIIKSSIDNLSIFDESLGKFITFRGPHKAIINSEGELATPEPTTGAPMYTGMSLWSNDSDNLSVKGWTYTATFNLKAADGKALNLPPATFTLATGQEVDLADVIRVPATPGYGLPQAEGAALRAEAAAFEAKQSAQSSAEDAQIAQSVRDEADQGLFNGLPGDLTTAKALTSWAILPEDVPSTLTATLTSNVVLTLPTPSPDKSGSVTLVVKQDPIGGHTITWPAGVLWSYGVKHIVSSDPGSIDLIHLFWTGGNWFGLVGGVKLA